MTQEDMEKHEESQGRYLRQISISLINKASACTAYSRYVLDIGQSEDWLALHISLLPCLLGYGMIARRLHSEQANNHTAEINPYLSWINNYVAADYTAAVEKGCGI